MGGKKIWIKNICLFIVSVVLLTSLLTGDDTNAYGEGRRAIYKNPINPDYESNDNGVKTSFRVRALNNLSGEIENGSNAMSLISVSEEDRKLSTVRNYADILDLSVYSNLTLCGDIANESGVDRDISFEIKMPKPKMEDTTKISFINSGLDIFTGNLTGINITYICEDMSVTESERKSGKAFDFRKLESIKVEGNMAAAQEFSFSLPMGIIEIVQQKPDTDEDIVDDLQSIEERHLNNVFDFEINYRYPITKSLNLSLATCQGSERRDDFITGKIVGIVKKDETNFDMLPYDIIEKFPDADRAYFSMFTTKAVKEDFVNDYSRVGLNISDLQGYVKDRGYSLILKNNALAQKSEFKVGQKIHVYDEDGLELNLGKRDKHGVLLSKVYVEFQKVLECKDSEIPFGSEWNKFDNLIWARVFNNEDSTEIDKDRVKVEGNVNTQVRGEYIIKYSYEITPGEWISNTAKVKVTDAEGEKGETESENPTDSKVRLDL